MHPSLRVPKPGRPVRDQAYEVREVTRVTKDAVYHRGLDGRGRAIMPRNVWDHDVQVVLRDRPKQVPQLAWDELCQAIGDDGRFTPHLMTSLRWLVDHGFITGQGHDWQVTAAGWLVAVWS